MRPSEPAELLPPLVLALPTADRVRAHRFYTAGLGLEAVGPVADDGVPEPLQIVLRDGVHLMLVPTDGFAWVVAGRAVADAGTAEALISITVPGQDDVDALCVRVWDAGGAIVSEGADKPWGYAATFADPDGHLWQVSAQAKEAVEP